MRTDLLDNKIKYSDDYHISKSIMVSKSKINQESETKIKIFIILKGLQY